MPAFSIQSQTPHAAVGVVNPCASLPPALPMLPVLAAVDDGLDFAMVSPAVGGAEQGFSTAVCAEAALPHAPTTELMFDLASSQEDTRVQAMPTTTSVPVTTTAVLTATTPMAVTTDGFEDAAVAAADAAVPPPPYLYRKTSTQFKAPGRITPSTLEKAMRDSSAAAADRAKRARVVIEAAEDFCALGAFGDNEEVGGVTKSVAASAVALAVAVVAEAPAVVAPIIPVVTVIRAPLKAFARAVPSVASAATRKRAPLPPPESSIADGVESHDCF